MSGLHSSAKIKHRKLIVIKEALNTDRHPHFLAQHKIKQFSWGKIWNKNKVHYQMSPRHGGSQT